MKLAKRKLKRRGIKLYNKYFFNSPEIINEVVRQHDNNLIIDDSICNVVFNTINITIEQIYEIILYYPNLLKEKKIITDEIINNIYVNYGETIKIMKKNRGVNVRSRLVNSASTRSKKNSLNINIHSENIKLVKLCPYLNIPLIYGSTKSTKHSPSLDRITPSKGYIKDNIQVISMLANQMKSSASKEELIIFSKNVLKLHI